MLAINDVAEEELVALFERTAGFGATSARKLVKERETGGLFLDAADLNVRVTGISYTRLASHFSVTFASRENAAVSPLTPAANASQSPPKPSLIQESFVSEAQSPASSFHDETKGEATASDSTEIVATASLESLSLNEKNHGEVIFATFNCCRMSPLADCFETKLTVVERLVKDTPQLSALFLQELFGNAAGRVAMHLRSSTGDQSWTAAGCGSDGSSEVVRHSHPKAYGVSCNAVVYNARTLRLIAHTYVSVGEGNAEPAFKRPPHVCIFEIVRLPRASRSRLLAAVNVHIVYRDPRRELLRLGRLVSAVRAACVRALRQGKAIGLPREDVVIVLAGDFNRAACDNSPDFQSLHEAGFVELVSSNIDVGACGSSTHANASSGELQLQFLREKTTAAGSRLDNIFVARASRDALLDAWVYQVGGAGRRLGESGRASAGRLRAERSDHLPLVAMLRLGNTAESTPWQCIAEFSVTVRVQQ